MIYKERIQQLLEALGTKMNVIESVSNGTLRLPNEDVKKIISEIKSLLERINNLVENDR